MNSALFTTPYTRFNSNNLKCNETLCSKVSSFRELLKIDEYLEKNDSFSVIKEQQGSVTRISKRSSEDMQKDKARKIRSTVTSRNLSCFQEKYTPTSTTVLKAHSKMLIKRERSKSSELSDIDKSEKDHFPKNSSDGRKQAEEENTETDVSDIGNALFSCPFELVEIYSSKKESSSFSERLPKTSEEVSIRTVPKGDSESTKSTNSEEHIWLLSGIRSNKIKEEITVIDTNEVEWREQNGQNNGVSKQNVRETSLDVVQNENTPLESTRDQQDLHKPKVDVELKRTNKISQLLERSRLGETSGVTTLQPETKNSLNSTSISNQSNKSNLKKSQGKLDKKIYLEESNISKNFLRYNTEQKSYANSVDLFSSNHIKSVDNIIEKYKCQSANLTSSDESNASNSTNVCKQSCVSSDGSRLSKLVKFKDANITEDFETDLSSVKNITSEARNMNFDSLREKRMKIIIERQKNKTNNIDVERETVNEIDNRMSSIKNNRIFKTVDTEAEVHRVSEKELRRVDIGDSRNEIIDCKKERANIDYENVRICKILMTIHEQLSHDWKKIEDIRIKLQSAIPLDPIGFVMTLQLLNKTIARCKSYIHSSNDRFKAESEITNLLSKYVVQLMHSVSKNKLILEEQQFEYAQSKLLREHNLNQKKRILNEVISFSDHWTNEISLLIEIISDLVKNIMVNNEEKENVKNPRKYKSMNHRVSNASSTNDTKQKGAAIRPRIAKVNSTKKDNNVETRIDLALNSINPTKQAKSKTSMTVVHSARSKEKEKLLDVVQNKVIEKKANSTTRDAEKGKLTKKQTPININQPKQLILRQKYRIFNNAQPAWRPGGKVRISSSKSTTVLTQKSRPLIQTKEKVNQPIENIKETKQERSTGECKKKISSEAYSTNDMLHTQIPDNSKSLNKKSSTSLKISPRVTSKAETLKVTSKGYNGHLHGTKTFVSSKKSKKTVSNDKIVKQRNSKESKVLSVLEEIIKSTKPSKLEEKSSTNLTNCYQCQAEIDSASLVEPISIAEKMKINEEEPTRDIDSSQFVKKRPKFGETFHEKLSNLIETTSEESIIPLPDTILSKQFSSVPTTSVKEDTINVLANGNFENSRAKVHSSSISIASASCMANLSSASDFTTKIESSKCCQTSFNSISSSNVSYQEQKNEKSERCSSLQKNFIDCNQDGQRSKNSLLCEKSEVNSHAMSLIMLKEFLCDQGVDVGLVNRAEQRLKKKRKARRGLKKSVTLTDVYSSVPCLQNACNRGDKLKESTESHNYPFLQPTLEKKDATTFTIRNSSDASSQTSPQWRLTKGSQTIPEREAKRRVTEMQTETASMRHVATECHQNTPKGINNLMNRNKHVSSMTESRMISHNYTETIKVSYDSKLVATEHVDRSSDSKKNVKDFCQNFNDSLGKFTEARGKEYAEENVCKNDQKLRESYHHASNKSHKFYNKSSRDTRKTDKICEPDLSTSIDSLDMSSASSESCVCNKTVLSEESLEPALKTVPSEVIAALQAAAIRGRNNICRAIDLYKRHIKGKLKKHRKELNCQKEDTKIQKEVLQAISKSNSVSNVMRKSSGHFGRNEVVEISKKLRQVEIVTSFGKKSVVDCDKSDDEISEFVSTSAISNSFSESTFEKTKIGTLIESPDDVVLKEVKSQKKLCTCSEARIRKMEGDSTQKHNRISIFSRESLLPLVHCILCSLVFWCLQFTITCDII